ncbi:TPA: type VI secretion system baseplate subunit TssG, partial [Proteus mirabilis]|nr:type VI secretion system baseplate subunit TssG [Proteus mirabilis]
SLGSHIYDCNGKCTIEISELSLERYMRFLPNGSDFAPLVAFVSYIFHEQLAWDLRLSIAEKQAEGFRLGHQQHNQLGWQSFLGQPAKKPDVTITVLE